MPKLKMAIDYNLPQDEALKRIKRLLEEVRVEFAGKVTNLTESWSDNRGTFSFSAMSFKISGVLTVQRSKVDLDANLPFTALPFKGNIETTIRQRAQKLLI